VQGATAILAIAHGTGGSLGLRQRQATVIMEREEIMADTKGASSRAFREREETAGLLGMARQGQASWCGKCTSLRPAPPLIRARSVSSDFSDKIEWIRASGKHRSYFLQRRCAAPPGDLAPMGLRPWRRGPAMVTRTSSTATWTS